MPSGRCPYCHRHTVFTTLTAIAPLNNVKRGIRNGSISLAECGHNDCRAIVYRECDYRNDEILFDMYPPVELEADEELPDTIKRSFEEALGVFSGGNWNSAVQACGRTLQDATALMKPEGADDDEWRKKRLFNRIEAIDDSVLPPTLKEWAHEARLSRVLAAHGDEYNDYWAKDIDAKETVEFTKWFLRYAFVLPEQLKRRKKRLAEEANKPG